MNAYAKAVILTVFIFLSGVMIGIFIDNYRLSEVRNSISEAQINWDDARLLNLYIEKLGEKSCNLALEQNLKFNNNIYKKGLEVEKSINVNLFTPDIKQEWRRYVLLQTQFWFNSILLKEKCGFSYNNIVHIYRLENTPQNEAVDNKVQSSVLLKLKETCGNQIMLIPLTADIDLTVIDSIVKQFNITKYPAIIVDETQVFQGLTGLDELQEIVKC